MHWHGAIPRNYEATPVPVLCCWILQAQGLSLATRRRFRLAALDLVLEKNMVFMVLVSWLGLLG